MKGIFLGRENIKLQIFPDEPTFVCLAPNLGFPTHEANFQMHLNGSKTMVHPAKKKTRDNREWIHEHAYLFVEKQIN